MTEAYDIRVVDDPIALRDLCARLCQLPRLGLDTEFHAEHRYWPELMLVQLAEPDGPVWLIDARRLNDLTPLGPVLEKVEIVVHGGQQDVALMRRATGSVPPRLIDTQRAAAFLGLGFPTRLPTIARALLGRDIEKAVGLSDWTTRPLTARQREYAAEDAVLTLQLTVELERRLTARGRWRWAVEASAETVTEALDEPDDASHWLGWDIASALDDTERAALQALLDWREEVGKALNQPVRSVLSDGLALDLARRRPVSLEDLQDNRRLPASLARRHGRALLEVLQRAATTTTRPPEPPSPPQVLFAQALELWAAIVERELEVPRSLILPRALALRVARRGLGALQGWRGELARQGGLDAFLDGRRRIGVAGDLIALTPEP